MKVQAGARRPGCREANKGIIERVRLLRPVLPGGKVQVIIGGLTVLHFEMASMTVALVPLA